MDTKIFIPKNYYIEKIIEPIELFYYAAQKPHHCFCNNGFYILSLHVLSYSLYGKILQGNDLQKMCNAYNSLLNKKILNGDKISRGTYKIKEEIYEKQFFSVINYSELKKIANLGRSKYNIFQYFCALIGSFNSDIDVDGNNYIIGTQHMTYFSELLNISPNTLSSYNKILEDSKMIYFVRKYGENSTDIWYCRYSDKNLLDKYTHNIKDICNNQYNKGNLRRSIVQRYNRFVKNPEIFSPEKVLELKELCVSYNEEMDRLGGDYLKRKKDLTVFIT